MKSKLSAALAAAGCLLAASPANAISTASHRGATTSSVPGAVLFDTRPSAPSPAAFYAPGSTLVAADYLARPQPREISSGWLVLTARRQLPR
jgi:hypothetical protein